VSFVSIVCCAESSEFSVSLHGEFSVSPHGKSSESDESNRFK